MRIGTIGTGSIVAKMITNMQLTKELTVEAVYSRRQETADAFAAQFHISKTYTDLDAFLQDPDIDCVYIASPNSLHYEQVKRVLSAGKHVICEKPFTPTYAEAQELAQLAKDRKLLLLEAITTVYHPNYQRVRELLPALGNLQMISATFCQYSSRYDAFMAGELPNVFNPAFAGGCLMDINLYNIYFIAELLGIPQELHYFAHKHPNGIDTHGILILEYPDVLCQCTASKASAAANEIQLIGDKGYMRLTPSANNCQTLSIKCSGSEEQLFTEPESGWYYEVQALAHILEARDYETCYKRLDKTLEVVTILEKARNQLYI